MYVHVVGMASAQTENTLLDSWVFGLDTCSNPLVGQSRCEILLPILFQLRKNASNLA